MFGFPGLYVADGAAMPGPVGVDPSFTIAAFADRVAEGIAGAGAVTGSAATPDLRFERGRGWLSFDVH